jgi:hypothetical protein
MASEGELAERHLRRIYDVLIDARRRFRTGEYGLYEFHQAISTLIDQISGIVQSMDETERSADDDE